MRRFALLLLIALSAIPVVRAGELKSFKNWVVGCDNLRNCTALGLVSEDGENIAYVKITRSSAPAAEPEVTLVFSTEAKPDAKLELTLDPPLADALAPGPLTPASDEDSLRANLDSAAGRRFIGAAQKAQSLKVTVLASAAFPGDGPASATVSLSGAAAALLYMDDVQKRVGTTTALKAAGEKDASSIPPLPAEPVIAAAKLQELEEPLPPKPKALASKRGEEGCYNNPDPMAVRISPSLLLWGVCVDAGAYNVSYDFFLAENGKVRPTLFELPAGLGKGAGLLTNPYLSEDGLTLSEFSKGRGIGDCGSIGSWAWDGTRFRLAAYSAMTECRGVLSDDWPVLFRARVTSK